MIVLGIESSCDETAASIVEMTDLSTNGSARSNCCLRSNIVASSMDLHAVYGGVVPEIAARSHIEAINPVVAEALEQAKCTWADIDAIAVTYGAGLGGSLLVGVMAARTLAITKGKPLYAINHVEGHVYANFLTSTTLENYVLPAKQPDFPVLALIVSGGHSQLVLFRDHFDYTLLGQTQDDAIGEAFDKVAKIIGLPYPGGPSVEKKAAEGDSTAFNFPKSQMKITNADLDALRETYVTKQRTEAPLPDDKKYVAPHFSYDFSFSGLKTAVLRAAQAAIGKDYTFPSKDLAGALSESQKADIAASFQRVAMETVVDKTMQAFNEFSPASVVIAGGVAASPELRRQLSECLPIPISYTDRKLCTDNGAMIATLGCFHVKYGRPTADPYSLDIAPNLSM